MKAILFDAGNTLLHLDYPWLAELTRRLGGEGLAADDIGRAVAAVGRQGWPAPAVNDRPTAFFAGYFGAVAESVGLSVAAARAFWQTAEWEHLTDPRGIWRCPAPAAREVLDSLAARGLALGVVSNADGRVEQQLAAAGLREPLETVIDSYVVGVEKPDPRIFRIALERLEVDGPDALYVGDLLALDVEGAKAAGLRALLYDPWDAYPELHQGRIRTLRELLDPSVR